MEFMAYRAALLAAMVALATLNREMTGLLIVLSAVAAYKKQFLYWLPALFTWGFIVLVFRIIYPVENVFTVAHLIEINTESWRVGNFIFYGGLMLPALLIFWHRLRFASRRLLIQSAIVLIPYFALWFLFASYEEVRLLMPLIILGIPIYATSA